METSEDIWEAENKKLNKELTNLRQDLKERDGCLKTKLRILEDRSRRSNIRVEGIQVRGDVHTQFVTRNVKMTFSFQPTHPP